MKKAISILFLLFMCSQGFGQKYVLVWSDEFNIPGLPDSTKWDYEVGKVRNNELQYFSAKRLENSRIEDTVLIIEAHKEAYKGADYTSASIISKGVGDWKYGKMEIRAKVPTGKGTWPALWMMPSYSEYGGWPRSGEIDIMEYIGAKPQNLHYNVHFEGTNGSGHESYASGAVDAIKDPWKKFLIFTFVWTPEKMEWYANGVKYHEYVKPADDHRVWPFNKEFFMMMGLSYGGNWGGMYGVDDSKLPHKFLVDYIRVYQLQESEGPFSLTIEPAYGGEIQVSPELESYPENTEVTLTAVPEENFNFKAWRHQSGANPNTFHINKNTIVMPSFLREGELLSNGNFDYGFQNWNFYVNNSDAISYTKEIEKGRLVLNVTKTTGTDWHFGFQENGIALKEGKYKLSFNAHADEAKNMLITISKNYGDWSAYISKKASITQADSTYEIDINFPIDDENVRLFFGIGNFSGKFYIDNISLSKVVPTNSSFIEDSEKTLKIFPNPNPGEFTVSLEPNQVSEKSRIEIIDFSGKKITSKTKLKEVNRFKCQNLNPGLYFIRLITPSYTEVHKFVVSK